MAMKSDLIPRVITAIVAIPTLIAIIVFAPHWAFFLFLMFAGGVSIWEFCGITFAEEHPGGRIFSVVVGMGLMAALYFDPYVTPDLVLPSLSGAALLTFLFYLFFYRDQKRATFHIGASLTAMLYGGVLLTFVAMLGRDGGDAGWMWILLALTLVWSSDTGAYFAGSFFGKHKLYPSVSPNKSIQGSLGGLVGTLVFTFAFNAIFNHFFPDTWTSLSVLQILVLAIPANFLGQTGDLAESLFKRAHDVKDSGTIIYGHGGILDRIDALFFAAPWIYFFLLYGVQHTGA